MTDTPEKKYPVRPPAPGPAVVLDQGALYQALVAEMARRGYSHAKQVCDDTGIDRNTIGRFLHRGRTGQVVTGQRRGLNVNAYLTLTAWVTGATPFGATALRPIPRMSSTATPVHHYDDPEA